MLGFFIVIKCKRFLKKTATELQDGLMFDLMLADL